MSAMTGHIAGIDISHYGAGIVTLKNGELVKTRTANERHPIRALPSRENDFLPFRVDLGVPARLSRECEIELSELPGRPGNDSEYSAHIGRACGHLVQQFLKPHRGRCAVIAADSPSIECEEAVVAAARRHYGVNCTLVPWPIAATAFYIKEAYNDIGDSPSRNRSVLAIRRTNKDSYTLVKTHVVRDPVSGRDVPLRDYASDPRESAGPDGIEKAIRNIVARTDRAWHLAIAGRHPHELSSLKSAETKINMLVGELGLGVCNSDISISSDQDPTTLALGAAWVMNSMAQDMVPYYVTAPRIELLVSTLLYYPGFRGQRSKTHKSMWHDCLMGQTAVIDGHQVIPANRTIQFNSKTIPTLQAKTNTTTTLQVAFNGVDVRDTEFFVPEHSSTTVFADYAGEYSVGSGRPILTVRINDMELSGTVDWKTAAETSQRRNDITELVHGDFLDEERYANYYDTEWRHHNYNQPNPQNLTPRMYNEWKKYFLGRMKDDDSTFAHNPVLVVDE